MSTALLGLLLASIAAQESDPPRVLFLTHSAGFAHEVVQRPDADTLSHAERSFLEASEPRFEATVSQDCAELERLEAYDAVVFYTTGELPVSDATREGLLDWVRDGGAFIGVHCASDTFYEFPPYLEMVGATFDGHPWHQEVAVRVEDKGHPATRGLGDGFRLADEIYQFREFARHPVNVLLSLDLSSVDGALGRRLDDDYPLAWWRDYGRGRVFYTALGHRPEVWEHAGFLGHLMAGIDWAAGDQDLPAKAPDGAVRLMGRDLEDRWYHRIGGAFRWRHVAGALEVRPQSGDLVSVQEFGDAAIHVEFMVPSEPDAQGQAKGNSGVYVQGRYEVQVLDSFGLESQLGDCAAIYGQSAPALNVCRRPERWQSYDIRFRAPRFDGRGVKLASARMSVWHNGVLVQDDVEIDGPTLAGLGDDEVASGPLMLQDHGDLVRYRNVWVLPEASR